MEDIFLVKIQILFCVCPLGLTINLNFNKSNMVYFQKGFGAFCCSCISERRNTCRFKKVSITDILYRRTRDNNNTTRNSTFHTTNRNCFFRHFPGWFIPGKMNWTESDRICLWAWCLNSSFNFEFDYDKWYKSSAHGCESIEVEFGDGIMFEYNEYREIECPNTYHISLYTGRECYNCSIYSLAFLAPNVYYRVYLIRSACYLILCSFPLALLEQKQEEVEK